MGSHMTPRRRQAAGPPDAPRATVDEFMGFPRGSIVCFLHLLPGEKDVSCAFLNKNKDKLLSSKWDFGVTSLLRGQLPKFLNSGGRHGSTSAFLGPSKCLCPVGFLNQGSLLCRRIVLLTEGPGCQAERALVHSEGTGVCVRSGSVPSSEPPRAASWLLASCVLSTRFCRS